MHSDNMWQNSLEPNNYTSKFTELFNGFQRIALQLALNIRILLEKLYSPVKRTSHI